MFRESLEKIIDNCDGAVAGVVMGFDGIAVDTVSRDGDVDMNTISMEFSFVLGQVRKAADLLEVGSLEEVSIRSGSLIFVVRVLSDDYFVGIALKPDGNFGKGRYLMRMALPALRAEI